MDSRLFHLGYVNSCKYIDGIHANQLATVYSAVLMSHGYSRGIKKLPDYRRFSLQDRLP